MPFTIEEIQHTGLGQLSQQELKSAIEAFNGFEQLFEKTWVDNYFKGMQSRYFVLDLIQAWNDWKQISDLPKANEIIPRWKSGLYEHGVKSELRILAYLRKSKLDIELFPPVNNRLADARIKLPTKKWTYVEISRRHFSKTHIQAQFILTELSAAAAKVKVGRHGKIGIKREITKNQVAEIKKWLENLQAEPAYFKDIAVFHTTGIETGGADPGDLSTLFVKTPRRFGTNFKSDNGQIVHKGTAILHTEDVGAKEMLESEAKQLPKNESGIIVLDLTHVVDGVKEWEPLILNRFKPSINTRISGVILSSTFLTQNGPETTGKFLKNPYAKIPISQDLIEILNSYFNKQ